MSRLTLRLPESLHRQLEAQARLENVSLNQYLVYALTRHVAMAYTVLPVPEEAREQQRVVFDALLQRLGPSDPDAVREFLAERQGISPDPELDRSMTTTVRRRIAEALEASNR